jgi:hypothetical protein
MTGTSRRWIAMLIASAFLLAECSRTIHLDQWVASCPLTMPASDCEGVATQFIGQLYSGEPAVRADSGGRVFVEPISGCSTENFHADPEGGCWRAWAPITTGRSCMVFVRAKSGFVDMDFVMIRGDAYQVGYGPEPPPPGTTPC